MWFVVYGQGRSLGVLGNPGKSAIRNFRSLADAQSFVASCVAKGLRATISFRDIATPAA